jgi:uncharacterized lipoprotein YmbA
MKTRALLLLLACAGCSQLMPVKDKAVHYLLAPLATEKPLKATTPAIAVNRAALPGYLDTEQFVTRRDDLLVTSDIDLWAEPLDDGISRVVAANLRNLTGSMNIQPVQRFTTLDYSHLLELRVSQFENDSAGKMVLRGAWRMQPVTGADASEHAFRITVPLKSDATDVRSRVKAMNEALFRLAREIPMP